MIKQYVLDTNVLMHEPEAFLRFEDNEVIIPIACIEELDNNKNRQDLVGYHVRQAINNLKNLRTLGNLYKGVRLPSNGVVKIERNHQDLSCLSDGLDRSKTDNRILAVCKNLAMENKRKGRQIKTILVTKDLAMTLKADAEEIEVQDFENDKVTVDEIYSGHTSLQLDSYRLEEFNDKGYISLLSKETDNLYPNQFVKVINNINPKHTILTKVEDDRLVPLKFAERIERNGIKKIKPLNLEQKYAMELLMDDSLPLVTLAGQAGSGKTLLAMATALEKMETIYRKVIITRPTVPTGQDLGFLPGEKREKLRPWMSSYFDNLDFIYNIAGESANTGKKGKYSRDYVDIEELVMSFESQGLLEIDALTYFKGRSFAKTLMIIDEVQDLTPHLAKMFLTRAGKDTKIVLLGDPSNNQIDNPLVDEKSNGLIFTIERFKQSKLAGHITLSETERSAIAAEALRLM